MRKYEEQGVDYIILRKVLKSESINEDKFLTYQKFNVTPHNQNRHGSMV
jgi:hypothetical protein